MKNYMPATVAGHNTDFDEKLGDMPYAKLIYQALIGAKGHRLVLRDIYKWIESNTEKALDPAFRGWQNSVRHNLSMNGVSLNYCLCERIWTAE